MRARIACGENDSLTHKFILKTESGTAINLTGYTVTLTWTRRGVVVTYTVADHLQVTNALAGEVVMSWLVGEGPERGGYTGRVTLSKSGYAYSSVQMPALYIS